VTLLTQLDRGGHEATKDLAKGLVRRNSVASEFASRNRCRPIASGAVETPRFSMIVSTVSERQLTGESFARAAMVTRAAPETHRFGAVGKSQSGEEDSNCASVTRAPRARSGIAVFLASLSPQSILEPNKEWYEIVSWLHQEDRGQRIEDLVRKSRRLPCRELACDLLTARGKPLPESGGLVGR